MIFIHNSANVAQDAIIGEGCKIWQNAQVRENAIIGEHCIISKDVYIAENVRIGNRCKVQNSVSIFSGVILQDDVFVGPAATFTNDKIPRAFNNEWKITKTLVKRGASIGANATIVCGVIIGEYAMVGAGAVVVSDVEDYSLVLGNPARHKHYIDKMGNKVDAKPE